MQEEDQKIIRKASCIMMKYTAIQMSHSAKRDFQVSYGNLWLLFVYPFWADLQCKHHTKTSGSLRNLIYAKRKARLYFSYSRLQKSSWWSLQPVPPTANPETWWGHTILSAFTDKKKKKRLRGGKPWCIPPTTKNLVGYEHLFHRHITRQDTCSVLLSLLRHISINTYKSFKQIRLQ